MKNIKKFNESFSENKYFHLIDYSGKIINSNLDKDSVLELIGVELKLHIKNFFDDDPENPDMDNLVYYIQHFFKKMGGMDLSLLTSQTKLETYKLDELGVEEIRKLF